MKDSKVLLSTDPRGRIIEGVISGALYPGMVVQITAVAMDGNGRHTWGVYDRDADGDHPQGPIGILLERGEGYDYQTAYS